MKEWRTSPQYLLDQDSKIETFASLNAISDLTDNDCASEFYANSRPREDERWSAYLHPALGHIRRVTIECWRPFSRKDLHLDRLVGWKASFSSAFWLVVCGLLRCQICEFTGELFNRILPVLTDTTLCKMGLDRRSTAFGQALRGVQFEVGI